MSRSELQAQPVQDRDAGATDLLQQLAGLTECGNAEGYTCFTARHSHGLKSVEVEQPAIAIVLRGHKQVSADRLRMRFEPGDMLVMHRRCHLDVENIADLSSAQYLTIAIPFCSEVLDAARLLWQEPADDDGQPFARYKAETFAPWLQQWMTALRAGHYSDARSALAALAVALCRHGHASLVWTPTPSIASQVRELVNADPAREWQSADFESALLMSGATLRRRLAAEHTSLRDVVLNARMAHALQLLSSTRLPVKTVAARVGYRSGSSFARQFSARYGSEPSSIGNSIGD